MTNFLILHTLRLAHSTTALQMKTDGTNKKLILYPVNKLDKETKNTGIAKGNEIDEKEMERIAKLSVICLTELFSINQLIRKEKGPKIITSNKTNPDTNSS